MGKAWTHLRKPGIRLQLALWYCLVFTVLLGLFGTIFELNLQKALLTSVDTNLQLRAQQIAASVSLKNGDITLHDSTGELSGLIDDDNDEPNGAAVEHFNYQAPNFDVDLDALVRILGTGATDEYITPAFKALMIPTSSIDQSFQGTPWIGTVESHRGQSIRLYSLALRQNGKIYGVLQVGTSLSALGSTQRDVLLQLLLTAPFVLLLGGLGSYWLALRAFQPIERLIAAARTIKAGDLRQRVPVPQTNDEIRHLALMFNEMIQSLEQIFQRQRRFTADASHELRTPVAAIRSMTDVALAQEPSYEECITVLRSVNGQAERLGRLISDLLTLVRADEDHIPFEWETVCLGPLACDVVATIEWLAVERGIGLQVQARTAGVVRGDEARLMQMIMNLLENALNYTVSGGTVLVSVETTASGVELRVSDTGIGIEQEHLAHIFERFYRTDSARSRASGGTGLGLSIVQWIVRKHQGTIAVESQPGKGTTFLITLPADKGTSS